ncbi:MAG: hypothetical protein K6A44_05005 [bacterium]|nr:hypothetical protein [bacterium]
MNVEKTNIDLFNSLLDKIQEAQNTQEGNQTTSLTPKKDYGILKLSNDTEEDFSDLTFDESIIKAGADNSTTNTTATNQETQDTQSKTGASNEKTSTSSLDNLQTQMDEANTELGNVETLIENYEASNENLLAQIQQGKNGDTTINVSKCQKQYYEQQEQISLLTIKQLNLTNKINALKDIQEYKNTGAVANLDDDSEDKQEMLDILEQQQSIVNQLADVRAKKLTAMEKGDDSAVASYEKQELSLVKQNRSLELSKLKQLSVINSKNSEEMKVYTNSQLSEIGLKLDVEAKSDQNTVNRLYYTAKLSQLEAKKETTGDKNTLRSLEQEIWKTNNVINTYTETENSLQKALNTYNANGTTSALSSALESSDVNPTEMMKDDGNYTYNEKDILYKNGEKYTGEYCGKMYKKGKLFNGKLEDKTRTVKTTVKNKRTGKTTEKTSYVKIYYVDGEKYNGTKGKTRYVNGELAEGEVDGLMYKNGKTMTGLSTFTPLKADGKTPDTENAITRYYKKGQLGTGKYKGILYVNGVPFTGQYKKHNYVNGVKQ